MRYFGAHTSGENLVVHIGRGKTTTNAIPMIWMFPGQNTALLSRQEPRFTDLQAIAALGYPIIAGDWGTLPGGNWGDDTELASIESGITWANTNLGTRKDKIILGGESKGALGVLNVAWRN